MEKKATVNQSPVSDTVKLTPAHGAILTLKILLILSVAGNIYYFLSDGYSGTETADLLFNTVFGILLTCSVIFHNRKKGVYLLFAYLILELIYNYIICIAAAVNGQWSGVLSERIIGYTVFTAAAVYCLYRYYKSRLSLLR